MEPLDWNKTTGLLNGLSLADIERFISDPVTPSMYHAIGSYIVAAGKISDDIVIHAIDSYFDLPVETRVQIHHQEIENLMAEAARVKRWETGATHWLTDEDGRVCTDVLGLIIQYQKRHTRILNDIVIEHEKFNIV